MDIHLFGVSSNIVMDVCNAPLCYIGHIMISSDCIAQAI